MCPAFPTAGAREPLPGPDPALGLPGRRLAGLGGGAQGCACSPLSIPTEQRAFGLCVSAALPTEATAPSTLHLLQPWGSLGGWHASRGSLSEFLRRSLNGPADQQGLLQPLVRMRDPGNVAAAVPPLRCPTMPTDDPQGLAPSGSSRHCCYSPDKAPPAWAESERGGLGFRDMTLSLPRCVSLSSDRRSAFWVSEQPLVPP